MKNSNNMRNNPYYESSKFSKLNADMKETSYATAKNVQPSGIGSLQQQHNINTSSNNSNSKPYSYLTKITSNNKSLIPSLQ